jgi:N-acetylmuramoyl-L-alanine amidase
MRPTLLAAALAVLSPLAAEADEPETLSCLARAVYYEARGKSPEARAAIAHVVLNRAESTEFPDTPCEVVADGCQFSFMCDGKPEEMAEAEDRAAALRTATRVLEGELADPTGGALFFHSADASATGFFATRPEAGTIGGNVFYR